MPITKELKNVKNFESAGFTHEQAETLAEAIEVSHVDSHESLKEFMRNEFEKQSNELSSQIGALDNKLSQRISDLEVKMVTSQKDLLVKIFAIIVGTVGVAVTILKLF